MSHTGFEQAPLPMTAAHVQALNDGQFFLEHGLPLLRALAIEPYCRHCHALGLVPSIAVATQPHQFVFRCAHTSGWVKRHQVLELPPLLATLGWDLRCTKCQQLIQADNTRTDAHFLVTCPCSVRAMANPAAQSN